jgi:hypothetical protein
VALLVGTDGAIGRAVLGVGAGLHFYDHDVFAVASDEVGFGIARCQAVIASHYSVSLAAQVAMGEIFTTASHGLIAREDALATDVAKFVENRSYHLITFSLHSITLPRTT